MIEMSHKGFIVHSISGDHCFDVNYAVFIIKTDGCSMRRAQSSTTNNEREVGHV